MKSAEFSCTDLLSSSVLRLEEAKVHFGSKI